MLLIVGLVLGEPDMGTACMISLIAFGMLFVSGLSLSLCFCRSRRGTAGDLFADRACALIAYSVYKRILFSRR